MAIYMHPKIVHAKREGGGDVSWCHAIYKAFWSRGISRKRGAGRAHRRGGIPDLRRRTGTHLPLRNDRDNNHAASSTRNTKEHGEDKEEVNCEIQSPVSNMIPANKRVSFVTFAANVIYTDVVSNDVGPEVAKGQDGEDENDDSDCSNLPHSSVMDGDDLNPNERPLQ